MTLAHVTRATSSTWSIAAYQIQISYITRAKKRKSCSEKINKPTKITAKASKKSGEKGGLIGYFKGAWEELKLVRWPTRSATWAMTAAVLIFTFAFVVLILLLDAAFNWGFNQILK